MTICCLGRSFLTGLAIVSVLSRPTWAAGGTLVNSMVGPSLLFWEWHPCAAKPRPPIRISAHASFFGETPATHRAVPRTSLFLASMLDLGILNPTKEPGRKESPSSGYECQSVSCQTAGRLQTMRPGRALSGLLREPRAKPKCLRLPPHHRKPKPPSFLAH